MKGVKREQFRRLVRSIAVMIILVLESFIFYYVWNKYYSRGLWIEPFYAKGNIFIVLVYAAFMLLFLYIYGGFKIGYIKRGNLIYSQALSGLCANVIMYLQIVIPSSAGCASLACNDVGRFACNWNLFVFF